MVNNDATLEVTNSTPALSETPVFNNSMAAAGLLISGTCLEIKSVDGTGTMQVNAGGDVTTDHIIQGALIINGTAGNQGSVTIDASDSSGNPLADGLSLAGSLRPDGPFAAGGSSGGLIGDSTSSGSSFAPLSVSSDISSGAALISSAAAQGNSVPEPSTIALTVLAQLIVTASVARRVRREVARRR